MLQGRVVVHAGPGEEGEQPGRDPERLVDHPLRALGVVLHEDLEGWSALLRVPGLVGLHRGDHVGEADVARFQRVSGKRHELQVGEAGLEGEWELDGDVDHVRVHHHPVEGRSGRDDAPVVGVVGLERPVELRVLGDELVGQVQVHLRVPDFVQRSEHRHVAPRRGKPEATHPLLGKHGQVFDQRDGAEVRFGGRLPALVQGIENSGALQGSLDRVDRTFLLALGRHVVGIGALVRFIPALPGLAGYLTASRQPLGEDRLLVDIGPGPVDIAGDVVPLFPLHPCHSSLL